MRVPAAVLVAVSLASTLALVASQGRAPAGTARPAAAVTKDVTVHEGTSMSVAVSPDGRRLAVDFQGSVWVLPAAGGAATRITDVFNDARQPAWSPDGQTIAFFAYRDGGYDLWAVAPDGANQRKLTTGAYDDREPVWSHDGKRIAFSSDRGDPLGSNYNIWTLELATGALVQLTARVVGRDARSPDVLRDIETRFYGVFGWPRAALWAAAGWQVAFHAGAVLEVWVILQALSGGRTSLADAFVLESAGRLVTVLFKVIPFRIGVDEVGAAVVATALGVPASHGVALALVRKLRILVWNACGLVVLARARR